jgi:hypothetical protein
VEDPCSTEEKESFLTPFLPRGTNQGIETRSSFALTWRP